MSNIDAPREPSGDATTIRRIISLIDLTDLDDAHRPDGIERLIADASTHRTAAVCVWPEFVAAASRGLAAGDVRVATVANFPSGTNAVADVVAEVESSLASGADEIDVVLPWQSFLDGDVSHARAVVEACADLTAGADAALKVILETGELPVDEIGGAAELAVDCGADFLKTSTGKTGSGATPGAVAVLLDVVADHGGSIGVKPSGGVRTVADATALLDLADARLGPGWATPQTFRFGASGLLADALAALGRS